MRPVVGFVVNGYRTSTNAKRFVATCPQCPFEVTRSTRAAAAHVMSQHLAYVHELEAVQA